MPTPQTGGHLSFQPKEVSCKPFTIQGSYVIKNNNYNIWEGLLKGEAVVNSINIYYSLLHVLSQWFFSRDDIEI
jgi:hypothetical protein